MEKSNKEEIVFEATPFYVSPSSTLSATLLCRPLYFLKIHHLNWQHLKPVISFYARFMEYIEI